MLAGQVQQKREKQHQHEHEDRRLNDPSAHAFVVSPAFAIRAGAKAVKTVVARATSKRTAARKPVEHKKPPVVVGAAHCWAIALGTIHGDEPWTPALTIVTGLPTLWWSLPDRNLTLFLKFQMGRTASLSTCTEIAFCSSDTDNTTLVSPRRCTRMPSTPVRAPAVIRTLCPTFRNGHGCAGWPTEATLRMCSISRGSSGSGVFPTPTMPITPGMVRIGRRISTSNRANT